MLLVVVRGVVVVANCAYNAATMLHSRGCGKSNFRRRRRPASYAFFYYASGCVRVECFCSVVYNNFSDG